MPIEWPQDRTRNVAVFVDFANVHICFKHIRLFPKPTVTMMLEWIDALAKTIAENVRAVVYLDDRNLQRHEPTEWQLLHDTCQRLGFYVCNVSPKDGKDNVDAVMIDHMLELGKYPDPAVRFLLVSSDNDFLEVTKILKRSRNVYIGLPPQTGIPRFCSASSGFQWLAPGTWEAVAYYYAFNFHALADQDYDARVEYLRRHYPGFRTAWNIAQQVLNDFQARDHEFVSLEAVSDHLGQLGVQDSEQRNRLVAALQYNEVLRKRFGVFYAPNLKHQAFLTRCKAS